MSRAPVQLPIADSREEAARNLAVMTEASRFACPNGPELPPAKFAVGDRRRDGTMGIEVVITEVTGEAHPKTGERLYRVDSFRNPSSRPGRRVQERLLFPPKA